MKKEIKIIHDDEEIVAVNKPSGMMVHPDGFDTGPFLTDWIIENFPEIENVGEPVTTRTGSEVKRPGIVHRLDKDTSGLILVAKTDMSFHYLKSLFKNKQIDKTYHAFVYGSFKKDKGRIDRPIGKSSKNFRLWSAQRGAKGKLRNAITEYEVLGRYEDVSFLQIHPLTGRTHQIRVHMKAVNTPVVCDPLYAPKRDPLLGFKRTALHASKINFKNMNGKELFIRAPFPEDFKNAFDILGIGDFDLGTDVRNKA